MKRKVMEVLVMLAVLGVLLGGALPVYAQSPVVQPPLFAPPIYPGVGYTPNYSLWTPYYSIARIPYQNGELNHFLQAAQANGWRVDVLTPYSWGWEATLTRVPSFVGVTFAPRILFDWRLWIPGQTGS